MRGLGGDQDPEKHLVEKNITEVEKGGWSKEFLDGGGETTAPREGTGVRTEGGRETKRRMS